MSKIEEVQSRAEFPKMEEKVLEFWKENRIFEKSVEQRPEDNKYSFVDGPPFVSGMPHPAHLFVSIAKDVIPRYWTMKGKRVRRVFGWDCHGLPIEAKVNKKLGIKTNDQVTDEIGVKEYVKECRTYVEQHIQDWKWYIDRIGRWADMDNAYHTMYPEFNESVIWAFKQAWDKGLIYKGKRVSLYSTDTQTPVSNFEVAMDSDNYQDTTDTAVFVKFELKENPWSDRTDGKPVHMLAWTTTPWTIPSNFALAVNAAYKYVLVEFNEEFYVLNEDRVQYAFNVGEDEVGEDAGKTARVVDTFSTEKLVGLEYVPVYDFYVEDTTDKDFRVYELGDVTNTEGTGVLHIAPAFGEVDNMFGNEVGLSMHADIDEEGNMTVGPWEGTYLRDACEAITEDMAQKGNLLRSEQYTHRLPYYRGDNPLIYMAQESYFMDIQALKDRMLEVNEDINWIPDHFKHGRFENVVKNSPDWAISRNRFWATVMPIWESEDGDQLVVGSISEMMEYTDQITLEGEGDDKTYYMNGEKFMLHRDFCDDVVLTKDGKEYSRIPEVLDVWFDSGSVPFAEYGYPFKNVEEFENSFPADFIVEYSGQVRAWFNMLVRLSVVNFDKHPFKNVICHGVMAGNDGRKMSKTYGNYTDPKDILTNLGGEALRLYAMGSPLMAGGDMDWSDEELNEYVKTVLIPFWNTYRYFTLYATQHDWTPSTTDFTSEHVLDVWLQNYVADVSKDYASALENYDLPGSVRLIQPAIDTVSTWWIRRSRDRMAEGDVEALQSLYAALVQLVKTFAPQLPFLTEAMYQNLVVNAEVEGAKESVHLEYYPTDVEIDQELLMEMDLLREVASLGLNIREQAELKLRQPLSKAYASVKDPRLMDLLAAELNVKQIEYADSDKALPEGVDLEVRSQDKAYVALDLNLDSQLVSEGLVNEVVRNLQVARKKAGFEVGDKVTVNYDSTDDELLDLFATHQDQIMERVGAKDLVHKKSLEGEKYRVNDYEVLLELE